MHKRRRGLRQLADFNLSVFLLHEAIVVPLSYFLIGKPGRIIFFKEGPG